MPGFCQALIVKVRDILKLLRQDGWKQVRMKDSHRQFRHSEKPGTVTIAGKPGVEIPVGTLKNICKQASLKYDKHMKYAVVIEKGPESFGAYVPDLPGCAVAGESREEVVQLIQEAIELHLQSLKEHGDEIPSPVSSFEFVNVAGDSSFAARDLALQ